MVCKTLLAEKTHAALCIHTASVCVDCRPAHTWLLKIAFVQEVVMHACVCVCVSTPEAINN